MTRSRLNLASAKRPTHAGGRRYAPWLDDLTDKSGVYAIIDAGTRAVLYIGESHSGQLRDTITRHFRRWRIDPSTDATGRRRGGTTYDRQAVMVAHIVTPADKAIDAQYREIERLKPRDNTAGTTSAPNPPHQARIGPSIGNATSLIIDTEDGQRDEIKFDPPRPLHTLGQGDYLAIEYRGTNRRLGKARTINYIRRNGRPYFHDFAGAGREAWGNPTGSHIVIGPGARAGSGWIRG